MPRRRVLVSLFTDASWHPQTKKGSWGYWAKKDGEQAGIKGGGAFKDTVVSSNEAEFKAVANALHILVRENYIAAGMHVLVQTDNMHVITKMRPTALLKNSEECLAKAHIVRLATETGFSISFRHIKGHRPGGGRNWVNNECDRIAKEHRR